MMHIATETLASTAKLQQGTSVERTVHYSGALGISHLLCDTKYLGDLLGVAPTRDVVTCRKCLSIVRHVASDRAACESSLKEVTHTRAQSVLSTLASIARARPDGSTLVVRSEDALAITAYVESLSGKST